MLHRRLISVHHRKMVLLCSAIKEETSVITEILFFYLFTYIFVSYLKTQILFFGILFKEIISACFIVYVLVFHKLFIFTARTLFFEFYFVRDYFIRILLAKHIIIVFETRLLGRLTYRTVTLTFGLNFLLRIDVRHILKVRV